MASDFLSYKNRYSYLNRIYPFVKLVWVFLVAIGLFLFKTPYAGAIMFCYTLSLVLIGGKLSPLEVLRSGIVVFGLGFLLMIFHMLIDPGNVLWSWSIFSVTDYGLIQGPIFFFRLSVIVLASFLLIWTTDTRDLMNSLVQVGMPYRYAFTIFLALRFLPLIQREVEAVKSAHAIRGHGSGSGLKHRFKLWQRYMFTILINGIRKAETTADALECRGFGYQDKRTFVKEVRFRPSDLLLLIVTLFLLVALILMEQKVWISHLAL